MFSTALGYNASGFSTFLVHIVPCGIASVSPHLLKYTHTHREFWGRGLLPSRQTKVWKEKRFLQIWAHKEILKRQIAPINSAARLSLCYLSEAG